MNEYPPDLTAQEEADQQERFRKARASSELAPSEPPAKQGSLRCDGVVGLRSAPAKVSCARCEGTGFVWEGAGDCGPPNFCPVCVGDGTIEQRQPEPNQQL